MIYYLTYVKDTIGQNYLGIKIPNEVIDPFLDQLKTLLDKEEYEIYIDNQKKRDHEDYHITVINVAEYNNFTKNGFDKFINSLEPIFRYEIDDIKLQGIGTAEKSGNRAYFIVCQSDKLEAIRSRYDLPERDFHITIGFKWKDVFGVRKNQIIEIKKEDKN